MTPDEAIEVARVDQPKESDGWLSEAQNVGIKCGDWVSVTPDDYGNPVYGASWPGPSMKSSSDTKTLRSAE